MALQEKVRQDDNTEALMMVDTVIRLDYNTMQYKTFSRYHRIAEAAACGSNTDDTNNNSKVAIKMGQMKRGAAAAMDKSGLWGTDKKTSKKQQQQEKRHPQQITVREWWVDGVLDRSVDRSSGTVIDMGWVG